MTGLQTIEKLINENRLEEAVAKLSEIIADQPDHDEAYFMRGRVYQRMQNRPAAVSDYERAVAINPDSGARMALELARDVFNFFNPDLLNP